MTLAANVLLAPHFTASELRVTEAPDVIVNNARRVAAWLEVVRALLGNRPITVTSGYRTPDQNQKAGGEPTSDHMTGLAADFEVAGLSPFQVYNQLVAAQKAQALPAFDQIVFYAADNHIHVGLGARMRGELLFKTTEGSYVALAGAYLSQLRGYL